MSLAVGALPASSRYEVGVPPDVGGCHENEAEYGPGCALKASGAPGTMQDGPTLTSSSFDGALMPRAFTAWTRT